jgi:hypothetical protein
MYQRALKLYRELPGNYSEAARRLGCGRNLAKRLYLGPPYRDYEWARPIKLVLEDERRVAAAQVQAATEKLALTESAEYERARREEIETLTQEAQLKKLARSDVIAALAVATELVPAMRALGKVISAAAMPADGSPSDVKPKDAMRLLSSFTLMVQRMVGAADQLVSLGRLERGQTTSNVGLSVELSAEEAAAELSAIQELLTSKGGRPVLIAASGESVGATLDRHSLDELDS